jgi:FkbM family methyltransferase
MKARRMKSIYDFLPEALRGQMIEIVDIGASPIDGDPTYKPLLAAGRARVIGFEPNPAALAELQKLKGPNETYLPDALGDGREHTLHLCQSEGMSSLLRPNHQILKFFHMFADWGTVMETRPIRTRRLDDVETITDIDLLKVDVQGFELQILRHSPKRLADTVVAEIETNFLPMYENQPLFAEVEQFMRSQGFWFHRFEPLTSRVLAPMTINNNPYAGLSQVLWGDSVFVRDFTRLDQLPPGKLLKLAIILHDVYGSYDLALTALFAHDRATRTNSAGGWGDAYLAWISSEASRTPRTEA